MKKKVRVGINKGDIIGNSNMAIQAAIDYVSYLDGGIVEVGEGTYIIDGPIHLRNNVELAGVEGKTVFKKCDEEISPLIVDADLHEKQVTVENPDRFEIGQGIVIKNKGKTDMFFDTVAVITAKEGAVLFLDREIRKTMTVEDEGVVSTNFPVISGYNCQNVYISNIVIEGNMEKNSYADGCLNGGIFFFKSKSITIENCSICNYNGDGISYQVCSEVAVNKCKCINNGGKGIHPGGSTDGTITECLFKDNRMDGIFVCWRVKNHLIEKCISVGNGMSGLSIGHKDTHNTIRYNTFSDNAYYGIFFRNEPGAMGANFNTFEENLIKDNGTPGSEYGVAGIRIRGNTNNVRIINNKIIHERIPADKAIGICIEERAHDIIMEGNQLINCKEKVYSNWLL